MARRFRPVGGTEGSGYLPRKSEAVNGVSTCGCRPLLARFFGVLSGGPVASRPDAVVAPASRELAAEGALADAGGVALEVGASALAFRA